MVFFYGEDGLDDFLSVFLEVFIETGVGFGFRVLNFMWDYCSYLVRGGSFRITLKVFFYVFGIC